MADAVAKQQAETEEKARLMLRGVGRDYIDLVARIERAATDRVTTKGVIGALEAELVAGIADSSESHGAEITEAAEADLTLLWKRLVTLSNTHLKHRLKLDTPTGRPAWDAERADLLAELRAIGGGAVSRLQLARDLSREVAYARWRGAGFVLAGLAAAGGGVAAGMMGKPLLALGALAAMCLLVGLRYVTGKRGRAAIRSEIWRRADENRQLVALELESAASRGIVRYFDRLGEHLGPIEEMLGSEHAELEGWIRRHGDLSRELDRDSRKDAAPAG